MTRQTGAGSEEYSLSLRFAGRKPIKGEHLTGLDTLNGWLCTIVRAHRIFRVK